MRSSGRIRTPLVAAGVLGAGLLLAACSSGTEAASSSAAAPSSSAAAPASSAAAVSEEPADAGEPVNVAYLSFAVANTYDEPMLAAAQAVADASNATVTVFDAANDPDKQFSQLQDAVSSGTFDAIIVQAINGTGLIPQIEEAIAQGIKVVVMDQIVGPDLSTDQPQVDGLSGNVVFVPTEIGEKLGGLAVEACADKDPCDVGYIYAIKVSALDTAVRQGFDAATAGSSVTVAAEGENFFTVEGGLKAAQDMLQKNPDLDVIVSADQGIIGAQQAVQAAGISPLLIGYGGSEIGLGAVADGSWFGDVMQAPADEGTAAMTAAIAAVRDGTDTGAVNPLSSLPNGGVVTKDNVDQFTAQWKG